MHTNANARLRRVAAALGTGPAEVYRATEEKVPYATVRALFYTSTTPNVILAQRIARAFDKIAEVRAALSPFATTPQRITVELLWPECTVDEKEVGA